MTNVKIIAEIGINHDGSFDKAAALVSAAAAAGVHAVKFQYRNLDNAYASGNSREIGDEILLREIRKNYLSPEQLLALTRLSREQGMEAGISFFDVKDIQDFEKAGEISEDDKFSGKEELQKVVDDCNQKLEALRKKKEEEIMTV